MKTKIGIFILSFLLSNITIAGIDFSSSSMIGLVTETGDKMFLKDSNSKTITVVIEHYDINDSVVVPGLDEDSIRKSMDIVSRNILNSSVSSSIFKENKLNGLIELFESKGFDEKSATDISFGVLISENRNMNGTGFGFIKDNVKNITDKEIGELIVEGLKSISSSSMSTTKINGDKDFFTTSADVLDYFIDSGYTEKDALTITFAKEIVEVKTGEESAITYLEHNLNIDKDSAKELLDEADMAIAVMNGYHTSSSSMLGIIRKITRKKFEKIVLVDPTDDELEDLIRRKDLSDAHYVIGLNKEDVEIQLDNIESILKSDSSISLDDVSLEDKIEITKWEILSDFMQLQDSQGNIPEKNVVKALALSKYYRMAKSLQQRLYSLRNKGGIDLQRVGISPQPTTTPAFYSDIDSLSFRIVEIK